MSTAYYLYHAGNGKEDLERNLEPKELIGIRTCQGTAMGYSSLTPVFTFAMHPGQLAYMVSFHSQMLWVIDEYNQTMMITGFFDDVLKPCKVITYDWRNIPE